jgi:hypothetical protein
LWQQPGYCQISCAEIPDPSTCEAQIECFWNMDACDYGAI